MIKQNISNAFVSINSKKGTRKKNLTKEVNPIQEYIKISNPRTVNFKRKSHTIAAK